MKKVLLLILAIIALTGCKSKEDKAKELIESQLKSTMNDWSSYEFVKMSKMDSTFTSYIYTTEYENLIEKISNFELKKTDLTVCSDYPVLYGKARCKEMQDSVPILEDLINKTKEKIENNKKSFNSEFNGYKVEFTFRGNNSLGAKVLNSTIYLFDKDLTKIVDTIPIGGK